MYVRIYKARQQIWTSCWQRAYRAYALDISSSQNEFHGTDGSLVKVDELGAKDGAHVLCRFDGKIKRLRGFSTRQRIFEPQFHLSLYTHKMALPNVFTKSVADDIVGRIQKLTPDTTPIWGKMDATQMLAHCCVTYEMALENKHKPPGFLMQWMLRTFVKSSVVTEKPYPRGSTTAPAFLIKDIRDFDVEKQRLITYILEVQRLGAEQFDQKQSLSFGKLSSTEWNNMFYKHLDHHLGQFGC